jgi:hypothetical protein
MRRRDEEYRALFEFVPVALWVEDASDLKRYIDGLTASGVTDLKTFLAGDIERIKKFASLIRVTDVCQRSA